MSGLNTQTLMQQIAKRMSLSDTKNNDSYYLNPITPMTNTASSSPPSPIALPSSPESGYSVNLKRAPSDISTRLSVLTTPFSPIRESPTSPTAYTPALSKNTAISPLSERESMFDTDHQREDDNEQKIYPQIEENEIKMEPNPTHNYRHTQPMLNYNYNKKRTSIDFGHQLLS